MDPERQPLLSPVNAGVRSRRFRALTHEEVQIFQQETTWRRARFFLVFMFWAIMVMFMSIVVFILISAPPCKPGDINRVPSVPPVHMTFAPLISAGQALNDDNLYTL